MAWEIEYTDEFHEWWETLTLVEQAAVTYSVDLLIGYGPALDYPHSSKINRSRVPLRELRSQAAGRPLRTFYAFDPKRRAILLIGGDKTGDDRFYQRLVPLAEKIYRAYLEELGMED